MCGIELSIVVFDAKRVCSWRVLGSLHEKTWIRDPLDPASMITEYFFGM